MGGGGAGSNYAAGLVALLEDIICGILCAFEMQGMESEHTPEKPSSKIDIPVLIEANLRAKAAACGNCGGKADLACSGCTTTRYCRCAGMGGGL